MKVPSLKTFLELGNKRARTRIFDHSDYKEFCFHWRKAQRSARKGLPYFFDWDAGGVANCYGYSASTAQWGVWVCPETRKARWLIHRVSANGRSVKRAYMYGERGYLQDFHAAQELDDQRSQEPEVAEPLAI